MGSDAQKQLQKLTSDSMKSKLMNKPDISKALVPTWPAGCKRLTPGPGYLEACCAENVEYISTPIRHILPDAIETEDGQKQKVDIIIAATGFNV